MNCRTNQPIKLKFTIIALILVFINPFFSDAQNWPNWRGPNGDGTSSETNLPVKWDSLTNVLWKVSVPGIGHASPIVWGDRLFTVTAFPDKQEKAMLCYDSNSGALIWQKTISAFVFEGKHNDNSFASGTPATDGKKIYVSFLEGNEVVVAAYDYSGNQVWIQRPGTFSSPHGYSCSPVLYKDKVIINANSKENGFVAAFSQTDGKLLWRIIQQKPAHSFSTPLFREIGGRMQMIFCGSQEVASYNPDDGSRYWYVNGPSEDFCATPVYNEKSGLVLVSSAWPERHLLAIKPDGNGDVSATHIVWRSTDGAYYVPSPVCTDDYLFTTMTNGQVSCIEIATGKILWKENLGKQYSSAVLAGGLVYMPNDKGVITVIKPGPAFERIATNDIGEQMNASPAISNGKIYIRGYKHLFCIGIKKNSSIP